MISIKRLFFWAALPLLLTSAHADPEAFFSPGGDIQRRLTQMIDHASQTIDIAMYDLTAHSLMAALKRAGERGVEIRLLLDEKNLKANPRDQALTAAPHLTLRSLHGREPKRGEMHNKFAIVDERLVVTGSYNWSQAAEHTNYENVLIEDSAPLIQTYHQQFSSLWEQASAAKASGFPTHVKSKHARSHHSHPY